MNIKTKPIVTDRDMVGLHLEKTGLVENVKLGQCQFCGRKTMLLIEKNGEKMCPVCASLPGNISVSNNEIKEKKTQLSRYFLIEKLKRERMSKALIN
jgi:hypothetical protein